MKIRVWNYRLTTNPGTKYETVENFPTYEKAIASTGSISVRWRGQNVWDDFGFDEVTGDTYRINVQVFEVEVQGLYRETRYLPGEGIRVSVLPSASEGGWSPVYEVMVCKDRGGWFDRLERKAFYHRNRLVNRSAAHEYAIEVCRQILVGAIDGK